MAATMARADEGYAALERRRRGSPALHYARTSVVTHFGDEVGGAALARPHARSLALGVANGGIRAICEQTLHGHLITERIVDALRRRWTTVRGSARACRRDSAYATSYLSDNRAPVSNRAPV